MSLKTAPPSPMMMGALYVLSIDIFYHKKLFIYPWLLREIGPSFSTSCPNSVWALSTTIIAGSEELWGILW